MLRLFRGTGPGVILLTLTLAVAFWLVSLTIPETYSFGASIHPMPLSELIDSLMGSSVVVPQLISLAMVLVIASLLVSFNTGSFFINERTFLPATIYLVLLSLFPYWPVFNPVLPATILFIFAVMRIAGTYRQSGISYNFFDAALLISSGSLLYANLIWFGLIIFAGIFLLRTFNFTEAGVVIIGLITPYALLYGFYYVSGRDLSDLTMQITTALFRDSGDYVWSRMLIVTMVFVSLTLLIALVHLTSVLKSKKVRSRKIFAILLWILVVSLSVYLFVPSASAELFPLLLIPVSYLLPHFYLSMKRKKIMPELMFTGTLLLVVVLQLLRFLEVSI
jgi:hypothetical protein